MCDVDVWKAAAAAARREAGQLIITDGSDVPVEKKKKTALEISKIERV